MYLSIKNMFKGHSGLNTICDACLQKMSDQFDPLDKVQRPHQHLLSRDEHRQPHQARALGRPFLLVVVGWYQTSAFNNIWNVVFICLKKQYLLKLWKQHLKCCWMFLFDTDLPQQIRRGNRALPLDGVVDAHHNLKDVVWTFQPSPNYK